MTFGNFQFLFLCCSHRFLKICFSFENWRVCLSCGKPMYLRYSGTFWFEKLSQNLNFGFNTINVFLELNLQFMEKFVIWLSDLQFQALVLWYRKDVFCIEDLFKFQDYQVDLYLRQHWNDERLNNPAITEALDLNDPRLVQVNSYLRL